MVLVLGSNPQRPRARRWARPKPNLVNVVLSRAKRRLYVIWTDITVSEKHWNSLLLHLLAAS